MEMRRPVVARHRALSGYINLRQGIAMQSLISSCQRRNRAVRSFRVVIDGRRRAMPWGSYTEREDAERVTRRLRSLGIHARVIAPDDLPLKGTR